MFVPISDETSFSDSDKMTKAEPEEEEAKDKNEIEEIEEWNLFTLLRSYSLPNISNTPLENLFGTISSEVTQPPEAEDDEPDVVVPVVTFEDEDNDDQIWHLSNSKEIDQPVNTDQSNPVNPDQRRKSDDSNIFSYLESQRAYLENRVGVERLLRVYKLVSRSGSSLINTCELVNQIKVLSTQSKTLPPKSVQL